MSLPSLPSSWTEAVEKIFALKEELAARLLCSSGLEGIQDLRVEYVGRRSVLFQALQRLKNSPIEVRKAFGQQLKNLRLEMEALIETQSEKLLVEKRSAEIKKEAVDISLPGRPVLCGAAHPISQTIDFITEFFKACGFQIASGPEVESDYYNFEALNLPKEHPAQAENDSFWLSPKHLLRTHTSGIQIRTLESTPPPLRILAPGRVFRPDSDMTHTPMFHQIEGLLVQEDVNFAQLKGLLGACLQQLFRGQSPQVRFRPSDFPFTVPSAEVDLKIASHGEEWLEVLGCGMVHPKVLSAAGVDPERFKGFAFGMGVERLAMLRYGIPDLRSFYDNDLKFLKQFALL